MKYKINNKHIFCKGHVFEWLDFIPHYIKETTNNVNLKSVSYKKNTALKLVSNVCRRKPFSITDLRHPH